ncbi:MAG TPA: hypothetical protein VK177_19765 [Flavobacteriales bacterium]|nr:hypothetical protein [Flavobacteriales bacterium]
MICIVGEISPYNFERINHTPQDLPHIKTIRFRFRDASNNLYLVLVDHFEHDLYVVKFHLQRQVRHRLKYNNIINAYHARKVLHKCVAIGQRIYNENPKASFGFVGSPRIREFKDARGLEGYKLTKRYRVYFNLAATFFSSDVFDHIKNDNQSTYIMINKKHAIEKPGLFEAMRKTIGTSYSMDQLYPTYEILTAKEKKKSKNSSTGQM